MAIFILITMITSDLIGRKRKAGDKLEEVVDERIILKVKKAKAIPVTGREGP
jgi:hypothetical protein